MHCTQALFRTQDHYEVCYNNKHFDELLDVCKTFAKNIGEACEKGSMQGNGNVFNRRGEPGKLLLLIGVAFQISDLPDLVY